ncbi:hypothetical protein ABT337_20340 [Saccharopolyspora hirsuta]|uniref:PE domain-containing protein n=1 Tax=Saccharopolyspora hirsuta TaxID=1837 RepID=A0A5M7BMS2_SACHI|nr:hypothetical protein [Saccharopolyspora hirsuta]KAA5831099.1 hypothetical protein F1721_20245 [Saccharopolyspora hirsuta]
MTGFRVDPKALELAITKLEEVRDDADSLLQQAVNVKPGELTAQDSYTTKARQAIQERATGNAGSLTMAVKELRGKLNEKIDAYKATLEEYRRNDDAAATDANRIQREA